MNPGEIKAKLEKEKIEATWAALRTHQERDALIWVSPSVLLTDVGTAIAADHATLVAGWMEAGLIIKPGPELVKEWDKEPLRLFDMIIVQPFVLFQERPEEERDAQDELLQ